MTLSVSLTMTLMLSWCHHWSPLVTFLGTARGFNLILFDFTFVYIYGWRLVRSYLLSAKLAHPTAGPSKRM